MSRALAITGCGQSRRNAGFVLAITLWILTGITIAVALMTLWALDQVGQARIGHEMLEDEMGVYDTRDTLLYVASTRELTMAGIPTQVLAEDVQAVRRLDEMGAVMRDPVGDELRMDGHPYVGLGGVTFAIQDEAGLLPMAWPQAEDLDRFLVSHGVESSRVPRLRDTLLDYIDPDELNRLNGAERRDYERAGRPPPPNRRLLAPNELAMVLGWDELPTEQLQRITDHISPYYTGAVNLNTMPASLLPTWIPGCPTACDALVDRRSVLPFVSSYDVESLLVTRLPGDAAINFRFLAADTMRLTLWGRTGVAWRMHVQLTPLADRRGPWSILATYPIPRLPDDDPADQTGSTLFAYPSPDRR